jgi:hypothetical protein
MRERQRNLRLLDLNQGVLRNAGFGLHLDPRQRVVTKNLPPRFCDDRIINVPTLRIIIPGRVPGSSAIDEPHSGQKCLSIGLPLPPMLVNILSVPSMVTASLLARTSVAKTLPVNFWQSRQCHTVALVRSASAV